MRKILLILVLLVIGVFVAACLAWSNRENLAAHFLSRHLHVPVTLRSLDITKTEADLSRLWVGNPPRSQTSTAFSAETIQILSNLDQMLADPLIIDKIKISQIFVGLEYYSDKTSNWDYILSSKKPKEKKGRDYLIRKLVLENLTVEVMQPNGSIKRYPTIPRMEFHNISSATGFPVEEIEKAIFNLMMKDIFKQFNIQDLLQQALPNSPMKYFPNLFQ